ncbi:DUF2812 domain-containing protein [Paenibacillus rhizoplanae]
MPRGEYIYRLELLEKDPKEESDYLQFMEETGAERVPAGAPAKAKRTLINQRWVIFRRKASEGPFQIYSDADSKNQTLSANLQSLSVPRIP